MDLQTVLFFGCAGAGKGTQANLLKEYLDRHDHEHVTHHIVTGDKFRGFCEGDELFAQRRVRQLLDEGGLMPSFLPIWIWGGILIRDVQNKEHLLLDGFPRRPEEGVVLDSALRFFERPKPQVIVLNVPHDEVKRRLIETRKRHDDTEEEIARRLAWYETDVVPTIEVFRKSSYYQVHDVDAHGSIEDIHVRVLGALGFS